MLTVARAVRSRLVSRAVIYHEGRALITSLGQSSSHAVIPSPSPLNPGPARLPLNPGYRWFSLKADDLTIGPGSDDDFQPKFKAPADKGLTIHEHIEQDIKSNPVVLYMKGVPEAPQCGFSMMVVRILKSHGVRFVSRNVLEDDELRHGIKSFSQWPTVPQLYINGEFVGGCDIVMDMEKSGELGKKLTESV
eukprot:TRINITY_DN38477_c0_g1_i1.p1 TRINITY_DN38477_c0_g1~~TRINITY_DN38477_c0_g1_i1.p1  ORF type:complete len:192 (-),score=21.13 TRINITY_DN38477_c0_g1_i1:351-926(-)